MNIYTDCALYFEPLVLIWEPCITYSQALDILQMEVLRKLSMGDAITYGDYMYLNYRINLSRVISTVSTGVAIPFT